jgi:hypothetical protein
MCGIVNRWNGTPIQDAIRAGDRLIVSLLKNHGGTISSSFEIDELFVAAAIGNVSALCLLAGAHADLSMCYYDKVCQSLPMNSCLTSLHNFPKHSMPVKSLFQARAAMPNMPAHNARGCRSECRTLQERFLNSMQLTGLHIAARYGQVLALHHLVTMQSMDVNMDDVWGLTPLDHAVRQ